MTTPIAQGPVDVNVSPLPCPFCGKPADLEDHDTLYPSGAGWKDHEDGLRSYHNFRDVPKEQWCWGMHCPTPAGGCGAEIHGDSKDEALEKWNKRANGEVRGASRLAGEASSREAATSTVVLEGRETT